MKKAPGKAPKLKISESELQALILTYLRPLGLVHWRQNLGGVMQMSGGKVIYKKNPMKGFPDICGLTPHGTFWFIEIKSTKGKLTAEQSAWHDTLAISGAFGRVVRTFEEAQEFLTSLKNY